MMLTPSQFEELIHFTRALEILTKDLDNSPYFDPDARKHLEEAVRIYQEQVKSVPVS